MTTPLPTTDDDLVIERHFDAPIELVWQMWTDPARFAAWYGPTGASIPVAEMDLRAGGARRICMEVDTPGGPMQMWFSGVFVDIVVPTRLVYTEAMTDPDGNPLPSPGAHAVPTEVTVALAPANGRTRVLLTHRGIPAGSPGATGWQLALDKLDRLLTDLVG